MIYNLLKEITNTNKKETNKNIAEIETMRLGNGAKVVKTANDESWRYILDRVSGGVETLYLQVKNKKGDFGRRIRAEPLKSGGFSKAFLKAVNQVRNLSAPPNYKVVTELYDDGTRTKRLVKTGRGDLTRKFDARDWKKLGFTTAKEGKQLTKILRNSGVTFKTEEDISKLKNTFQQVSNLLSHPYIKKMDESSKRVTNLFRKNLGRFTLKKENVGYRGATTSYELSRIGATNDYVKYFSSAKLIYMRKLFTSLILHEACKFFITTKIIFKRFDEEKNEWVYTEPPAHFFSLPQTVTNNEEIPSKLDATIADIFRKIEEFLSKSSGWSIHKIVSSHLNVHKYQLTRGSSYFKLSQHFHRKVVNVKNTDDRCFLYSLIVALHKDELDLKHPDRLKQFEKFFSMYEFDNNDMPMSVDMTQKIEKYENIVGRNINVVRNIHGNNEVLPFFVSSNNHKETVTLMLCQNLKEQKNHFVFVPDLSRLLSSQVSKRERKYLFCPRCFANFTNQKDLDQHTELCKKHELTLTKMSEKDRLCFTHYSNLLPQYFVVYSDLECLVPKDAEHEPSGANYVITSKLHGGKIVREFHYTGVDPVRVLINNLKKDCSELYDQYFANTKEMNLTTEEETEFQKSTKCHVCGKGGFVNHHENQHHWQTKNKPHPNSKVRDHCHVTGEFRGSAHHSCNLNLRLEPKFPVVFHNMKGYDSHFIIKQLNDTDYDNLLVIPNNKEKFISFSLHYNRQFTNKKGKTYSKKAYEIRFIDSLSFLNSSLEKLAETLEETDFVHTRELVERFDGDRDQLFKLIKRKGVYPYEYMDSWSKMNKKNLPSFDCFISRLKSETNDYWKLSTQERNELWEDYQHAKKVWKAFGCVTLKDYHDLYLHSDVRLLADIFERFRKTAVEKFKLDPAHYYTLPSMAWDCMLKFTGVNLQLFTETERDFYLKMEDAKIGGISGTGGKRYAEANNKYLGTVDTLKKLTYIIYADANGLYSWAMSQKLPVGEFSFVENIGVDEILSDCDGDYGYFINGDFTIPDHLHDLMNDYPCFPENLCVQDEWLSDYQKKVKSLTGGSGSVPKLIPNLLPKKNYTIHSRLLKLFISLGCTVDNVNWVMRFRQEAFLKPYIDLCMNERSKRGITEFEKDFWKLLCNAVYGKTMENVRNRVNVSLLNPDSDKFQKSVNSQLYKCYYKVSDDLVLVDVGKKSVKLDKPIYVGIAVLCISKWLMYDFYYNCLKKHYPTATMIYTDTDSFIFEVETEDFYHDLLNNPDMLSRWDMSNYSPDHPMFESVDKDEVKTIINKNRKVVGMFKDETAGRPIQEVVAIRAKMYSILDCDGGQKNTGKGIKSSVLKKISHDKYKSCMFHNFDVNKAVGTEDMTLIQSHQHSVTTTTVNKKTLVAFDDKKSIMDDGITQLSYGHWRIR